MKNLFGKQAFLYEVQNKIYYIGFGLFEKCEIALDISRFEKLKAFIEKVGKERITSHVLSDNEIEQLCDLFKRVLFASDYQNQNTTRSYAERKKEFEMFCAGMTPQNEKELSDQIDLFESMYWYYHQTK